MVTKGQIKLLKKIQDEIQGLILPDNNPNKPLTKFQLGLRTGLIEANQIIEFYILGKR